MAARGKIPILALVLAAAALPGRAQVKAPRLVEDGDAEIPAEPPPASPGRARRDAAPEPAPAAPPAARPADARAPAAPPAA
ncbi:MAG TPA: hypothetical protein VFL83_17125, partial [Anaeromyxobacter sp.]|nr:hypothetical protein [Anaeromyxobacter sp.]